MKKYLFLALGVAALTSCSSDEVTELNQGNEIKFSVVADNDSRAHDIYCNNNLMSSFKLWANAPASQGAGKQVFMAGDVYTPDNGVWVSSGNKRYWPETAALDFYALVTKATVTYTNGGVPQIVDFSPETNASEQEDILYATMVGVTKPDNGVLPLNFRHALSQIEFMAKSSCKNIEVEVYGVGVFNAISKGTFTTATSDTDVNYEDDTHGTTTTQPTPQGTWNLSSEVADYEVTFDQVLLATEAKSLTLSTGNAIQTDEHDISNYANSMLLLPQLNTAQWDGVYTIGQEITGAYLGVKINIYNVVQLDEDTKVRTLIYGNETEGQEGKYAIVPVTYNWNQGMRYVYTFNFTDEGNGGINPEDGKEVLKDINLNVTVDDFMYGGFADATDMNQAENIQQPNP